MKRNAGVKVTALSGALIVLLLALTGGRSSTNSADDPRSPSSRVQAASPGLSTRQAVYHSDPNHIWNRLYRALHVRVARDGREYGYDEIDPLVWYETRHLLSGASYEEAISALDKFLDTNAQRSIADPMKRALLQRDLWAIFDWSTRTSYKPARQKRELQIRLAQAIRRLALTREQIEKLPNNYGLAVASKAFAGGYNPDQPKTPFLPPDLFQPDGPWVALSAHGGEHMARSHVYDFFGRSTFLVFMRLPDGREATLAYLKKLLDFPRPWIRDEQEPDRVLPNPALPQFPAGTQLALVRQVILIDDQGNLTPTNLTEQVQIRVHRAIPDATEGMQHDSNEAAKSLDVFEFKLSRERLFVGETGGLRAVAHDEKEFPLFQSHGWDLFEMSPEHGSMERHLRPVLRSCAQCHTSPGIHSMLSRQQRKVTASWETGYEASSTIYWKHSRYDWGLLKGLWELGPAAGPR